MTAEWLAAHIGGRLPDRALPAARGVAFHTAKLRPGDAFFALPGDTTHGIRFADDALRRGAAFIVSDAPHPLGVQVSDPAGALLALGRWARGERRTPVVGVTGSVGKTTTKALLAAALEAQSSPGNYNTPLALAATLVNAHLDKDAARGHPLVLELGIDHVGEMKTLLEIARPTHGVLTYIAESHLAGLFDLATIAREKAQLLGAAAYAFASVQAVRFLPSTLRARTTTYGLAPDADRPIARLGQADGAQTLRYRTSGHQDVTFTLPHLGDGPLQAAAAALAVAEALGVPVAEAARRLEGAALEPGRLHLLRRGDLSILDDSYNSNPASARQALAVLRSLPRPHAAVLGDMLELGPDSPRYHRELGAATRGLDLVIAIGDAARDIRAGNPDARWAPDLRAAAPLLKELPATGTILVKASRGMRFEQVVELLRQGAPA